MDINKLVDDCRDLISDYTSWPDDIVYEALEMQGYKDKEEREKLGVKEVVKRETGERSRWSYVMQSVWKIGDDYISFWWDAPATEGQEGQPTNMECSKVEKKVEVIEKVTYK